MYFHGYMLSPNGVTKVTFMCPWKSNTSVFDYKMTIILCHPVMVLNGVTMVT